MLLARHSSSFLRSFTAAVQRSFFVSGGRQIHLTSGVSGSSKLNNKIVTCREDIDDPRRCGEDAFVRLTERFPACIAVLDGVGGWGEIRGVDAGAVSHLLAAQIRQEFYDVWDPSLPPSSCATSASDLLSQAYAKLKLNAPRTTTGSTTACVAVINSDLLMDVVNVGDSGLFVVRDGKLVFETIPTVIRGRNRYEDIPKQLAIISAKHLNEGNVQSRVEEGSRATFQLQPRDWIFVASDGVLDNLWLPEHKKGLGTILFKDFLPKLNTRFTPAEMARLLVTECKTGIKIDDITAVVVRVDELDLSSLSRVQELDSAL